MRTRSVAAAANASVVISSWLGNAMRSPTETLEKGPASMRRHHPRMASRSALATNEGSVIPMCTAVTYETEEPSGVLRDVLERRSLVRVRLLGEAEHPLAEDVALHLVRPAVDRRAGREQDHLLERAAVGRVLAHEHRLGTEDLAADLAIEPEHVAHHQLRDVRRALARVARPHPQRRVLADLLQRVELREALADVGVFGLPGAGGDLDHPRRLFAPPPAGATGAHRADEVADALVELTRERSAERGPRRAAATAAEPGPLRGERGVGDGPAVVQAADEVPVRHPRAVDEHLVEHRPPGHLAQRPDLDAVLQHVEAEVRDAGVLRRVRVGARDEHAEVADLRGRRPHLLAGDDPLVTVFLGLALQ